MIGQNQLIGLAVSVALVGAAFAFGYHKGSVNEIEKAEKVRVALQEELFDLEDNLSQKNAENLRLAEANKGLINELENEAQNAPGSDNPGVGSTGGLQRLDRRWGKDSGTP